MRYLIQTYACSPYKRGKYAVLWRWITQLDKQAKNDD